MIYLLVIYLSITFTAFLICISIFYKLSYFIKRNNFLVENSPQEEVNFATKININFFTKIKIILIAFVLSFSIGWRIVLKALSQDDFITETAKLIYIQTLVDLYNDD